MKNHGITFILSIYESNAIDLVNDVLDNLQFKPSYMSPALQHTRVKYNKEQYMKALTKGISDKRRFSSVIRKDYDNSVCFRYDNFSGIITLIVISEETNRIIECYNNIIQKNTIISASIRDEVDGLLKNEFQIDRFKCMGIDTTNLKKIEDPVFKEIIDIEQFSGHSHEYGGIEFTSTYLMWFGKDFFRFVPQETLTSFKDCVSNETFDNGTVRIQLYENINDFNTEETDRRQWAFRKHTNIDKVAEEWNKEYLAMASKDKSGANMTIENGHFEHGGVKLVKLYLDNDNNTTTKRHAVKVKCVEYDSAGNVVFDDILSV